MTLDKPYRSWTSCYMCLFDLYTVVPVMNGHPRDQAKVSVHCRWPLIRGNLTLNVSVGALITWPYKAGGRSRRGSPKAGTTVYTRKTILPNMFAMKNNQLKLHIVTIK